MFPKACENRQGEKSVTLHMCSRPAGGHQFFSLRSSAAHAADVIEGEVVRVLDYPSSAAAGSAGRVECNEPSRRSQATVVHLDPNCIEKRMLPSQWHISEHAGSLCNGRMHSDLFCRVVSVPGVPSAHLLLSCACSP